MTRVLVVYGSRHGGTKGIAERTWDLVHDRPDDDVVKKHVTEWHERLAKLTTPGLL